MILKGIKLTTSTPKHVDRSLTFWKSQSAGVFGLVVINKIPIYMTKIRLTVLSLFRREGMQNNCEICNRKPTATAPKKRQDLINERCIDLLTE